MLAEVAVLTESLTELPHDSSSLSSAETEPDFDGAKVCKIIITQD